MFNVKKYKIEVENLHAIKMNAFMNALVKEKCSDFYLYNFYYSSNRNLKCI